jgi:phosphate transport system permease protein
MTTIAPVAPVAPVTRLGPAAKHRSRAIRNGVATACIVLSFLIVLVPLAMVVGYVIARGHQVFGYAFLTKEIPTPRTPGPGMGPAVLGTLLITGTATLMAVPLGVLGGVYLSEYGRGSVIAQVLRFFAEVMTGVPSIVMGLFVYTAVLLHTGSPGGLAGALALACLMLPIVIRTTDEMLRLVPGELREGSVALGSRQARTIVRIVLPAAAPGIVSGALLAVARAAGETAPLLFVIGSTYRSNRSLFGPNTSLSVQIFTNAASSYPAAQQRAWAAALTLIGIVFLFTVLARLITAFYSRRSTAT